MELSGKNLFFNLLTVDPDDSSMCVGQRKAPRAISCAKVEVFHQLYGLTLDDNVLSVLSILGPDTVVVNGASPTQSDMTRCVHIHLGNYGIIEKIELVAPIGLYARERSDRERLEKDITLCQEAFAEVMKRGAAEPK